MNILKPEKQHAVVAALVEGNSIRSTERMTAVHRDTIMRLLVRVGEGCTALMDYTMKNLTCTDIEVDEIWAYVGKKQRHLTKKDNPITMGDQWTYVALDRETKLVPSYLVGKRNARNTYAFMHDLSDRLANRVQLSSDALALYVEATERAFGGDVDYGRVVKVYEADAVGPGRYSPPQVVSAEKTRISGRPSKTRICTSHVERNNLSMRMEMRRFTRLTNGFSKKLENLQAAVALHFAHYNFCRRHTTIKVTPAMESGVVDSLWSIPELLHWADRARSCPQT